MKPDDPVTVTKPGPHEGKRGVIKRDAGIATEGPDKGKRFFWVEVEGTTWPSALMYHEGEIR